jgi:poly(3-hydroxybutyrate) depolymerase
VSPPAATPTPTPPVVPAQPDPGPPPSGTACNVDKDADGFFWRSSPKSDYVAYVPASYSPSAPMRVVIGLHGCGDDALNFAKWGINPWDGRGAQQHIGISVSGETGSNHCWSIGGDDDKVLAAIDDLATCFWVDRARVVIAGFSSGGELAYRVGLMHASKFAGILIENSSLYAAGSTPAALLAGAAWKIPVAHRAHTGDTVFPIAKVKADWQSIESSGFPLSTSEVAGGHDGTGDDWADFLIPHSASWGLPAGP